MFFGLGALFPELFSVDHEVAVSTPTHKAMKRIYADGLDVHHRLPVHGDGSKRAKGSDAPFQMAQGNMLVAWRFPNGTGKYVGGVAGPRNVLPPPVKSHPEKSFDQMV